MTLHLTEYHLPSAVDEDFRDLVRVSNAVDTHALGSDAIAMSAEQLLPALSNSARRRRRHFVAHLDGELVGRSSLTLTGGDDATSASGVVDVLPAFRGRGVGTALLEATERAGLDEGRPVMQCNVVHSPAGGEQLVPPTGFGAVGGDDPGVRFLVDHGYALQQVVRISRLGLGASVSEAPPLDAAWRLHRWSGATPEEWVPDLARLKTAMSTAAPSGDLTVAETVWSDQDLRDRDAEVAAGGRVLLSCVVEHVASGRLVALTEIDHGDAGLPAFQEDTLVLPEHRGHRLGTLVKAANLAQLRETAPGVTEIVTFNAEENRPMLDVNETLGFTPIGYEGVWEKRLA